MIFFSGCVRNISYPGKPVMLKKSNAELESRNGVRLGTSGGSLFNDHKGVGDIPVSMRIYTHACKIRKRTEETTKEMNEKSKVPSPFFLHVRCNKPKKKRKKIPDIYLLSLWGGRHFLLPHASPNHLFICDSPVDNPIVEGDLIFLKTWE